MQHNNRTHSHISGHMKTTNPLQPSRSHEEGKDRRRTWKSR